MNERQGFLLFDVPTDEDITTQWILPYTWDEAGSLASLPTSLTSEQVETITALIRYQVTHHAPSHGNSLEIASDEECSLYTACVRSLMSLDMRLRCDIETLVSEYHTRAYAIQYIEDYHEMSEDERAGYSEDGVTTSPSFTPPLLVTVCDKVHRGYPTRTTHYCVGTGETGGLTLLGAWCERNEDNEEYRVWASPHTRVREDESEHE